MLFSQYHVAVKLTYPYIHHCSKGTPLTSMCHCPKMAVVGQQSMNSQKTNAHKLHDTRSEGRGRERVTPKCVDCGAIHAIAKAEDKHN